ncbi:MAG: DUF4013 domain-containing protein [Methanobrevibacter sp.]|nr:DUF4013 domain-containing protein [Methanobrevibacter sp.]
MEISKLFKDALIYPTKNWNNYLILGVLLAIGGIAEAYQNFQQANAYQANFSSNFLMNTVLEQQFWQPDLIYLVFVLLAFVVTLISSGYALSIVRTTIGLEENIPDFKWSENIIDGIKVLVLSIAHFIIPFVLIFGGVFTQLYLISFIGFILFIPLALLLNIAIARLAETDNLVEAINFIETFNKIGEIGWSNYILWIIVFICALIGIFIGIFIISFVIGIIVGIITIILGTIPFITFIISILGALLFSPYIQIFSSRALGLLYNESKSY